MIVRMLKALVSASLLLGFLSPQASAGTIAILGDSISTGGASHSALAFDFDRMENVFTDRTDLGMDAGTRDFLKAEGIDKIDSERLDLARREFIHPLMWMFNSFVTAMSSHYLDTEEYAWGSLLGALRGDHVLIAARDGERAMHAKQQVDRLLEATEGRAVDNVFVFFTGNDICASVPEAITPEDEYVESIEEALHYYMKNAQSEGGHVTRIWLLNPLGVSQLTTSPVIQNKKIFAYGADHTCQELQSDQLDKKLNAEAPAGSNIGMRTIMTQLFSGGTFGLCPTLFAYHQTKSLDTLLPVSNALRAYGDGLSRLADKLNKLDPKFRIASLSSTSSLSFAADDIANDCFHLSVRGQLKVAQTIKTELQAKDRP